MQEDNEIQKMLRRTHMRLFNPPYVSPGGFEGPAGRKKKIALALFERGEYSKVIELIRKIPFDRRTVHDWNLKGQALKFLGQLNAAKGCFESALNLDEEAGDHQGLAIDKVALAEVTEDLGDRTAAWQLLNEASELYPGYRSAHVNRFCLCLEGDMDSAWRAFRDMERLNPDWPKDEDLWNGLCSDGDLSWLQTTDVWQHMEEQRAEMRQKVGGLIRHLENSDL